MTIQKKIANKIKEKKGLTLIGILLGAVAFGLIAFPMARWVMHMTQNIAANERSVAAIGSQLEMQAIMEDRWHIINDMTIDQLKAATTKTTTYGKYSVKEEYATAGKYNASTGACVAGTASGTEQVCRQVTMTVTGPAGTTQLGPVVAIRVATPSERMASLETRMTNAENKFANYSTTAQINSTLGNYYTKSQINSTLGSYATTAAVSNTLGNYYTKAQVDSKDSTITTNINNKFTSYYTAAQTDSKVAAVAASAGSVSLYEPRRDCWGGSCQGIYYQGTNNIGNGYTAATWNVPGRDNNSYDYTRQWLCIGKQCVPWTGWWND